MTGYTEYVKKAMKLGADHAKIIKTSTVVTAPWVFWKCKYGCRGFNSSLCCPPHTPDHRQTRDLLDSYETALLVHVSADPENENPVNLTDIVTTIERDLFLEGYYKVFGMGAGSCGFCGEKCSFRVCREPTKARPLLEACGVDVYGTVRNNGLKVNVLKDVSCTMNLFGLILIE